MTLKSLVILPIKDNLFGLIASNNLKKNDGLKLFLPIGENFFAGEHGLVPFNKSPIGVPLVVLVMLFGIVQVPVHFLYLLLHFLFLFLFNYLLPVFLQSLKV